MRVLLLPLPCTEDSITKDSLILALTEKLAFQQTLKKVEKPNNIPL